MQKIEVTYLQMVLIGIGIGAVLGLIPLVLGIIKGKKKLALWGFVASIAGGAVWSLLSIVVVSVFVWLILKKTPALGETAAESLSDSSQNQ